LVYRRGEDRTTLAWSDERGTPLSTFGDPGLYRNPAISPDGTRVAAAQGSETNSDIWIWDIARGISRHFTSDPGVEGFPVWSPDGKRIAFISDRGGQESIYVKSTEDSADASLVLNTGNTNRALQWSRDGRFLLFSQVDGKGSGDIWALPMEKGATPVPLVRTGAIETMPSLSPIHPASASRYRSAVADLQGGRLSS
jgi:TolB protein